MPRKTHKEPDDVKDSREVAKIIVKETYRLPEQGVENTVFFALARAKFNAYRYCLQLLSDKTADPAVQATLLLLVRQMEALEAAAPELTERAERPSRRTWR